VTARTGDRRAGTSIRPGRMALFKR